MFICSNKNKILFLIVLILDGISVFSYAQKNFSFSKKYSPEALQEDTRIIKDVILTMHPAIGIYKSKSFYESKFDQLIGSLKDSLTEKDYRVRLKYVINELYCGHTEVMSSKAYSKLIKPAKLNFLPYYLITVGGKVLVGAAIQPKTDSLLKSGTEILSINNIGVDSVIKQSMRFLNGDGSIVSGKKLFLRTGLNYSYPSLFGRPDSFLLECRIKDTLFKHWVKAVSLKDLPVRPILPKTDSTYKKYRKSNISSGNLEGDKSTLVLKIKSFRSLHYKKTYRKVFGKIRKENIENLVIDLRYNGGGNLMNSYRLLSYLIDTVETITLKTHVKNYPHKKYTRGNLNFRSAKIIMGLAGKKRRVGDTVYYTDKIKPSRKNHYSKNIYVLINGGSFSASCIVAAYLKEKNKAVFIGSETGGTREGCNAGVTPYYTLPNTKVKVRVPAFRIVHDINPETSGKGVLPDYEVNYSFIDLLARRDLEMKITKELILSKTKANK